MTERFTPSEEDMHCEEIKDCCRGEYTNVYTFDGSLALQSEDFIDVQDAETLIREYGTMAILSAAGADADGCFIYAVEEISFELGIVRAVSLIEPYLTTREELKELVRGNPNSIIYYMLSMREESHEERVIRHIRPCTLKAANEFVAKHHRHNDVVCGCKFAISLTQQGKDGDVMIAVLIAGRPVSRHLDDGMTLEITRLCIDPDVVPGNSASELYSRACQAAKALGFSKCITYTLESEPGSSLKGAGFTIAATGCGGTWTGERSRVHRLKDPDKKIPTEKKIRWERVLEQKPLFVKG